MEAIRESNVILNEAISGIKQVKVFATGGDWIERFSNILKERWYHAIRRGIWQQIPGRILMLVTYLFIGIIVIVIRITSPDSFIQMIPIFGTFAVAAFRLFPLISALGGLTMQVMAALPNCEAVYAILNEKLTHIEDGDRELDSFRFDIKFDNVTFSYKGRIRILEDVSITFEKGKTTAIVGRSGVGKTTFLNLLLRLFEPDKGEIRIDGFDLKEYRLSSWLNKIGFVSQDSFIFNDTVKNNITFRSNQHSDEEIIRVARYADADSFIAQLPEVYDTLVGDKGVRLSAGQSQRIAVARAMLRDPEILIFDEATNALDNISEAAVQKAIDEISRDHTVIVVAHRLSTIVNADKIIVLGNGKILEEGTHEELLARRGAYWELYRSQPV
jgi:ABC-type multidrug transport system fused ATPase/permease subunit